MQRLEDRYLVYSFILWLHKKREDTEEKVAVISCLADMFQLDLDDDTVLNMGIDIEEAFVDALERRKVTLSGLHGIPQENIGKFLELLDILREKGYFADAQEGSMEYQEKLEFAKKRYLERLNFHEGYTAEQLKGYGNRLVQAGAFSHACLFFSKAIETDPGNHIYYANRAAAYTHLHEYKRAVADCEHSISIDKNYSKSYSRLGTAWFYYGYYQKAVVAYKRALDLEPGNAAYLKDYEVAMEQVKLEGPISEEALQMEAWEAHQKLLLLPKQEEDETGDLSGEDNTDHEHVLTTGRSSRSSSKEKSKKQHHQQGEQEESGEVVERGDLDGENQEREQTKLDKFFEKHSKLAGVVNSAQSAMLKARNSEAKEALGAIGTQLLSAAAVAAQSSTDDSSKAEVVQRILANVASNAVQSEKGGQVMQTMAGLLNTVANDTNSTGEEKSRLLATIGALASVGSKDGGESTFSPEKLQSIMAAAVQAKATGGNTVDAALAAVKHAPLADVLAMLAEKGSNAGKSVTKDGSALNSVFGFASDAIQAGKDGESAHAKVAAVLSQFASNEQAQAMLSKVSSTVGDGDGTADKVQATLQHLTKMVHDTQDASAAQKLQAVLGSIAQTDTAQSILQTAMAKIAAADSSLSESSAPAAAVLLQAALSQAGHAGGGGGGVDTASLLGALGSNGMQAVMENEGLRNLLLNQMLNKT